MRTKRTELPNGYTIAATITFEGRDFTAGGGHVDDGHLICYPSKPDQTYPGIETFSPRAVHVTGTVSTWDSADIGTYVVTGYASGFRDRAGRRVKLTCYRVTLADGRQYVGRGLGAGMILRAKRAKVQVTR